MTIDRFIAYLTLACTLAALLGVLLSPVWYAVRRGVWPGVETAKLPTWARVVQMLIEILPNLPGAWRAGAGVPSVPPGTATPPSTPPTVPPLTILLVIALGLGVLGCPKWDRQECPTPGGYRCESNRPEFCAPGTPARWTPAGDEPCRAGESCALNAAGVAHCAPVVDGGAP